MTTPLFFMNERAENSGDPVAVGSNRRAGREKHVLLKSLEQRHGVLGGIKIVIDIAFAKPAN